MKIIKKVMTEQDKVEDIVCDMCGISCAIDIGGGTIIFEFATLFSNWGYGSIRDGESTELHICEPCVFKIGEQFNIKDKMFKEGYSIIE